MRIADETTETEEDYVAVVTAALEKSNAQAATPARRGHRPAPSAIRRLSGEGWTAEKQRAFLIRLAETGCVSHACAAVGLSRQSAYALRRRAPWSVFAIAWDTAIAMSRQALLDEATERAFAGREEPVWYHGEQVGTRIVHNDRLLMFLLGRKAEPAHPSLDTRELMQLWPSLLEWADRVLPPPLSPELLAEIEAEAGDATEA